jgi:starvation-inducible outer membrane lipoprotein
MRKEILYIILAGFLAISGCNSVISRDIRESAQPITGFLDVRQDPDKYIGQTIIIGGVIVSTLNHENASTSLAVLAYPLDRSGWPKTEEK